MIRKSIKTMTYKYVVSNFHKFIKYTEYNICF